MKVAIAHHNINEMVEFPFLTEEMIPENTRFYDGKQLCNFFTIDTLVPDVQRGELHVSSSPKYNLFAEDKTADQVNHSIVVILESPHKDEYGPNFTPIAPAKGATGRQINEKHLGRILQHPSVDMTHGTYPVVLANPVQWQTSLHEILGKSSNTQLKADVWSALWQRPYIQQDFYTRLAGYNPVCVINACTGANGKNSLNKQIQAFLNDKGFSSVRAYHPSSWDRHQHKMYGLDSLKP
ncbi:MAG: hypothetical protein ACNI27_07540 [Desulfovibrio sp.]